MENKKRKSFFDELGFKQTIEKLVDHIAKLYLEDNIPHVDMQLKSQLGY